MKILELCLSPDLGGLELYMWRAALALAATDQVLAVVAARSRLAQRFEGSGVRLHSFAARGHRLPIAAARRLARLIDAEQIDTLHLHWGNDLALAALAKRLSRRKPRLVYTRQMLITRSKRDPWHRLLYRQVDLMLTITRDLEASARALLPRGTPVEALYYGVKAPAAPLPEAERAALRAAWALPPDGFVVGLFGRIEHPKGQHLLVEALAKAKQDGREMYGVIVGHAMDEDYLAALKRDVANMDLADRIRFLGFTDEPQRFMQACEVVALTTYRETFGLVLADAMRATVAVVGSDSGGVPEIIEDGATGLLFQPGDAGSLYVALAQLQAMPELRRRLAAAGKARADALFDEERHFAALRERLLKR